MSVHPPPSNDELLLMQFYKWEENATLFNIYRIICENSQKHLMYSEISSKYNEQFASAKKRTPGNILASKITPLEVAHYCKKLEKCGFVLSTTNPNSSEKKIILNAIERQRKFNSSMYIDMGHLLKISNSTTFQSPEFQVPDPLPSRRSRVNSLVKQDS